MFRIKRRNMLATCTSSSLVLLDAPTLKRAPTSIGPDTIRSLKSPTAVTWSQDNSHLFVAQAGGIHKFEPAGHHAGLVYETTHPITTLATRDKGDSLLFNNETEIAILGTQSGIVTQKFNSHKTNVISLSLSNDTTLLASTSVDIVLVHNLTMASHTVLRGLPSGEITTCVFHTHTRTRLLIGIGNQLAIYDTSRPSSPAKVISLEKTRSGPIVSIACSPFSKTLIAVACSGGSVGLVDLDKEKGLLRTLSLRTPLSSISFSPEGASIYAGTENGKLLILDLRALDKTPRSITISQTGERIVCIAVQRKLKPDESAKSTIKPLSQQDVNKTPARRGPAALSAEKKTLAVKPTKPTIAVTPPRSRVTSTASTPAKPRSTSTTALTSTPKLPIRTRTISTTTITSPAARSVSTPARPSTAIGRVGSTRKTSKPSDIGKDENANVLSNGKLDVSVNSKNLLDLPGKRKENVTPKVDSGRVRKTSTTSRISSGQSTRSRTTSTTSRTGMSSRTVSGASTSALSSTTARTSPSLKKKHSYEAISPIPPVPKLPAAFEEQLTSIKFTSSRTPSPDLSLPENTPITPLPKRKDKGKAKEVSSGLNVLGLCTPEVRRWVEAGSEEKTNGRKVGFTDPEEPVASGSGSSLSSSGNAENDDAGLQFQEAKIELTVQISPRRPLSQAKATSSWAAVPSPLRNSNSSSINDTDDPMKTVPPGPSANNPAHDLLQALIKDALYDFRRETKAEIIGLHLDLVRMGRGWRKEMREAMEEWSKELNEVREENRRLREENDRMKRGF